MDARFPAAIREKTLAEAGNRWNSEEMDVSSRVKLSLPKIKLKLFPYSEQCDLEFDSPLLIDNKFFFRHLYSRYRHHIAGNAQTVANMQKNDENTLLNSENIKILEIIHYLEDNVMKLSINKDNRRFCVMGREENIWKSLGVKTETWEDSMTIRIGFKGQDYEFQIHKVKPVQGTNDTTRCPSTLISPITLQEAGADARLEVPQVLPNGGVIKSNMAKDQSVGPSSNKSSAPKERFDTPNKLNMFGLKLDRVDSNGSGLAASPRGKWDLQVSNSKMSNSGSILNQGTYQKKLDKFLNLWRESTQRPNLQQSIQFLETELMEAEYQLLQKPLVKLASPEHTLDGEQITKVEPEPDLAKLFSIARENVKESTLAASDPHKDLDLAFILEESDSSSGKEEPATNGHTHSCAKGKKPQDIGSHGGLGSKGKPDLKSTPLNNKGKESPGKSGPRTHKQIKGATDEKLCQFVLEKREQKAGGGAISATKYDDILAELAILEQEEQERMRKESGHSGQCLTHTKPGAKDSSSAVQEELQNIGCAICYMAEQDMQERGQLDCGHRFCFQCIKDWAKVTNLCPLCKRAFLKITKSNQHSNEIEEIPVESKAVDLDELLQEPDLQNGRLGVSAAEDHCYACEEEEDEDQMLVCDHCLTKCCHIYCLSPPLDHIPYEPWYCDFCIREHNLRTTLPQANFFGGRRRRRAPVLDDDEDEESMPALSRPVLSRPAESRAGPERAASLVRQASTQSNRRESRQSQAAGRRETNRGRGRGRGGVGGNRSQSIEDEDDNWLAEATHSRGQQQRNNRERSQSSRAESSSERSNQRGAVYQRNSNFINTTEALREFRENRRQTRVERTQGTAGGRQVLPPAPEPRQFPSLVAARSFARATQLRFEQDAFEDEFS